MFKLTLICIINTVFVIVTPKTFPSNLKKCTISSPNCFKEAIPGALAFLRNGNENLHIMKLEPIFIPKMDLGNTSTSSLNVNLVFENVNVYGTTISEILNVEGSFSDDNCLWNITSLVPEVKLVAQYKLQGRILVIPINGKGNSTTIIRDSNVIFSLTCEKYMKKNEKYIRIKNFLVKTTPKNVIYDFENLVDGNEQLSKEVLKTMNDNAVSVHQDIGPLVDEVMALVNKQIMNQFFNNFPEKEIFLQ